MLTAKDSLEDVKEMRDLLKSFDGKMAAEAAPLSVNNAKNENIAIKALSGRHLA